MGCAGQRLSFELDTAAARLRCALREVWRAALPLCVAPCIIICNLYCCTRILLGTAATVLPVCHRGRGSSEVNGLEMLLNACVLICLTATASASLSGCACSCLPDWALENALKTHACLVSSQSILIERKCRSDLTWLSFHILNYLVECV